MSHMLIKWEKPYIRKYFFKIVYIQSIAETVFLIESAGCKYNQLLLTFEKKSKHLQ